MNQNDGGPAFPGPDTDAEEVIEDAFAFADDAIFTRSNPIRGGNTQHINELRAALARIAEPHTTLEGCKAIAAEALKP